MLMAAIACVLPKTQALPRVIKFALHPFVKRGHGKVLAGGSAANPLRMLVAALSCALVRAARPAFAIAVVLVACLAVMGAPGHVNALGFALAVGPVASSKPEEVLDALKTAFEEFKAANDERLKQVEQKGSADGALVNKVENLNRAITDMSAQVDELLATANRPHLGGDSKADRSAIKAHRDAFNAFVRKGIDDGLSDLEIKASVSVGTVADGGYAVPTELDRTIYELEVRENPLIGAVSDITVSTPNYTKLVDKHGMSSGWVGETGARPATNTPTLAPVTPPMGEIYANPQATQQSLDDIFFDVEAWLNAGVATEFGTQIGTGIVTGNGTNKMKGFLQKTITNEVDGTRAFGSVQYVPTGVAAALSDATHKAFDVLVDVIQSMKPKNRAQASFAMNALTLGAYRKVKDTTDNYIWQPALIAGQPSTLLGHPVLEVSDMPDVAANAFAVAFANWKAAYLLVRRVGIRVLRDPYTNKPYVGFYTTQRIGGDVVDSEAIKLLKVAAS